MWIALSLAGAGWMAMSLVNPNPGLFLASAWGNPGGGFGGALGGGKSAFRDVAKALTSAT